MPCVWRLRALNPNPYNSQILIPLCWVCSAKVGVRPLPLCKLVDNFEAQYEYVANAGTLFTLKTNLQAPRYRYFS